MKNNGIREKIEAILACPECYSDLKIGETEMLCRSCGAKYQKKNGKYYFREVSSTDTDDSFDRVKSAIKRYEKFYRFLTLVVAPTLKMKNLKKFVPAGDLVVVEIGSGNTNLDDRWIKIDYFDYPNVHIICDSERLPIRDCVVDVHYNVSVLEHMRDPFRVVSQVHRTLKEKGIVISSVPFLVPYHASPHDYHRFTSSGIKNLFNQFSMVEFGVRSGPFSALLWTLQETLASLFAFGSTRLRNLLLVTLYIILFPVKLLDLLFLFYPLRSAEGIASNFYFVGTKK